MTNTAFRSRGRLLALLAAASLLAAGGARADVLEIGDDGAVVTYAAPMVHTDEGARAIRPPAPEKSGGESVRAAIAEAAERYTLNPRLLEAVAWQESRFRPAAVSPKGALGVMQLMPGTARDLGVDALDWRQNVFGGAAYLSQMLRRYGGDVRLGLAAYNAGPGAVDRHGGVPPYAETQAYVSSVLSRVALGR